MAQIEYLRVIWWGFWCSTNSSSWRMAYQEKDKFCLIIIPWFILQKQKKLPEYAFFIRFKRFASPNLLPLVISAPLFWFKRANSKTIRWYFFDRDFFHESLLFDSMRLDPKWKIAQSCQYFQRNFFFTKKFNFNDNNGTKRILSLLVLLLLQWIRYFWFILLKD